MKNKHLILGAMMAFAVVTACSDDFLDRPPKDTLVDANFFRTDEQVLAGSALLYNSVWFDYNDKSSYNLGDFRGGTLYRAWNDRDNVEFNTTANSPRNGEAWRSFFNVVGQSNTLIQNVNRYAGESVSESVKQHAIAEARFMRATAYTFLVMNYGPVPIIENNQTLLSDTTVARHEVESVWEFITRDYLAAAEILPETPLQEGRITKWSAEGMLARTYLYRSGVNNGGSRRQEHLDKAKEYAERVITMSGRSLLPNYADLFRFPYDNNRESLFENQWVFHPSAWGYSNTMVSQITYSNDIANGDGWGGDIGASYWMLSLYPGLMEDGFTNDRRLHATFMMPGASYPEISQTVMDANNRPVEQRLIFPFTGTDQNLANVKKYVVGKAVDVGGEAAQQRYGHNTYMLRLAEMYLIYAEAALGNSESTSDAKAIEYYNAVHQRAGLPEHEGVLTWEDIFHEKMREFAMEGRSWYELVSLHYYNPEKAYSIISDQDRGHYFIEPDQFPNPTSWTITQTEWAADNRYFRAHEGNFRIPIPAAEMSQAPNLRKDPVPYDFGG